MPAKRPHHRARSREPHFGLRLGVFLAVVVLVVGVAFWLLRPPPSSQSADLTVTMTMAGFQPGRLTIPAGQPIAVRLVNPDSRFHTDGGGVHQFAIPDLGIDVRVQPESAMVVQLPAAQPGTYAFYCDVCCGGKESPTMQGAIVVG
ncbi:MAG: cupredoxin domain-containing protein [Chloroflexi bacterium]|nr:cupredoxin domain-containing protein [Chloroflexota bacterium]